jgi:hypothetical protein
MPTNCFLIERLPLEVAIALNLGELKAIKFYRVLEAKAIK